VYQLLAGSRAQRTLLETESSKDFDPEGGRSSTWMNAATPFGVGDSEVIPCPAVSLRSTAG